MRKKKGEIYLFKSRWKPPLPLPPPPPSSSYLCPVCCLCVHTSLQVCTYIHTYNMTRPRTLSPLPFANQRLFAPHPPMSALRNQLYSSYLGGQSLAPSGSLVIHLTRFTRRMSALKRANKSPSGEGKLQTNGSRGRGFSGSISPLAWAREIDMSPEPFEPLEPQGSRPLPKGQASSP